MPDSNAIPRKPEPDAIPGWLLRLEERLGLLGPVQLMVFRSFGTPDLLHLAGRVVEQKSTEGTTEEASTWQNIINTLHRLESTEIPGATSAPTNHSCSSTPTQRESRSPPRSFG